MHWSLPQTQYIQTKVKIIRYHIVYTPSRASSIYDNTIQLKQICLYYDRNVILMKSPLGKVTDTIKFLPVKTPKLDGQ